MNQRLTASQAEKTKKITMIGLMTAVTCILGPLSLPLPFSPVPITLTNFAVFLSIYILGMKYGTISLLIYLALGTIGLLFVVQRRSWEASRTDRGIFVRFHLPCTHPWIFYAEIS